MADIWAWNSLIKDPSYVTMNDKSTERDKRICIIVIYQKIIV